MLFSFFFFLFSPALYSSCPKESKNAIKNEKCRFFFLLVIVWYTLHYIRNSPKSWCRDKCKCRRKFTTSGRHYDMSTTCQLHFQLRLKGNECHYQKKMIWRRWKFPLTYFLTRTLYLSRPMSSSHNALLYLDVREHAHAYGSLETTMPQQNELLIPSYLFTIYYHQKWRRIVTSLKRSITKNICNCHYNLVKQTYHKKNIYTETQLDEAHGASDFVPLHQMTCDWFKDYLRRIFSLQHVENDENLQHHRGEDALQ